MKKAIIKWLFGNNWEEYWELHDKYCKELNAHIESLEENQKLRLELMEKIESHIRTLDFSQKLMDLLKENGIDYSEIKY